MLIFLVVPSPAIVERRVDFPLPTGPVMTIKLPFLVATFCEPNPSSLSFSCSMELSTSKTISCSNFADL